MICSSIQAGRLVVLDFDMTCYPTEDIILPRFFFQKARDGNVSVWLQRVSPAYSVFC